MGQNKNGYFVYSVAVRNLLVLTSVKKKQNVNVSVPREIGA